MATPTHCRPGFLPAKKLSSELVKLFTVHKAFPNPQGAGGFSSINFSDSGDFLVASLNEDSVHLYDAQLGIVKSQHSNKKYGVGVAEFTTDSDHIIQTSTKIDDNIRLLALPTNTFSRYFVGHTDRVVSLKMCPKSPTFLSNSLDGTLRFWDIRSRSCQGGITRLDRDVVATYDPQGLVIAVAQDEALKLYDVRTFDAGPFLDTPLPTIDGAWSSIKFSPNGDMIMVVTFGPKILLYDAMTGRFMNILESVESKPASKPTEASFSPDSAFVFAGSSDGKIHCWDTVTGKRFESLTSQGDTHINCVKFNTSMMELVSASSDLSFWLPTLEDME